MESFWKYSAPDTGDVIDIVVSMPLKAVAASTIEGEEEAEFSLLHEKPVIAVATRPEKIMDLKSVDFTGAPSFF
jgi:hypothetical protein